MMQRKSAKDLSLGILAIAFVLFVYGTYKAIVIVSKTQTSTSEGVYTSYVTFSEEIVKQAQVLTKECESKLCQVQRVLDFASNIPYKTNRFQQKSPQKTIQENFGDCDDKSNLLISMLHALDIEAYFVLVPKHIFVIVSINDSRLGKTKALWVQGKKYYILESTAKDSRVGFTLKYSLDEIDVIIEPFANEKMALDGLKYY